jgi:predicted CXXCH cytochrome family protein
MSMMSRIPWIMAAALLFGSPGQDIHSVQDSGWNAGLRHGAPANSESEVDAAVNAGRNAPEPIRIAARGVAGSVHDFSGITGRVGDACSACHVPHVQAVRPAEREGNQAILELFRVGGQREVFEPGRYMPGATSLICLSCHNGTIASSTVGTSHALFATGFATGDGERAFAFRDHPIGMEYPSGRNDYRPLGAVLSDGRIRLPEGRVECISCHDPHNHAGAEKLLVMSNRRSALCLACHEK